MTITYPTDKDASIITFGVGERIDIAAKRVHEVWIGDQRCVFVIGE